MTSNNDVHVQAYMDAIAAFNAGDLQPTIDQYNEKCNWPGFGTTRAEIAAALEGYRQMGWVRHDVLSMCSAGALVVGIARNTMADGTSFLVRAAMRFAEDGTVIEVQALTDDAPELTLPAGAPA
jgi:hypothetical protein